MALDPAYFFYSDGTITLTNGSDIATGTFTAWDPAVLPFDFVFPNNGTSGMSVIEEVLAMDQIRLAQPWGGPTLTDVPYFMVRWTKHTDPKVYALRLSDYLARLKAIPENFEEVGQQVAADAAAVASALSTITQAASDVDADRQAVDLAAAGIETAQQTTLEARDEAVAARDVAVSAAGSTQALWDTRAAVLGANIPGPVQYLRTAGYAAVGDGGGALYKRVSAPATPKAWHFQSADGAWWELAEVSVRVEMLGAKAQSGFDNYSALQNALAFKQPSGGEVILAGSSYEISQQLLMEGTGVTLRGTGEFGPTLVQTNPTSGIIHSTGQFNAIKDLTFRYSGTPTAGSAILVTGPFNRINNILIRSCYVGIECGLGSQGTKLRQLAIFDYESVAFYIHDVNDVYLSQFLFNAGNVTRGAAGGIRMVNKVEAFMVSDGDILVGQHAMTSDAAVNAGGQRPAYNRFTNVFFDSSVNSVGLNKMAATEFIGCWWSLGRAGAGAPGATVSNSDSLTFTNCTFGNCGTHGCVVEATSKRIDFDNCRFESNSFTAGAGVSAGLLFADNATDFSVRGGSARNGMFGGQQKHGIYISPGCDRYVIDGVNVTGNTNTGIFGIGTGTEKYVKSVIGYRTENRGVASVTLNASGQGTIAHGLASVPTTARVQPHTTGMMSATIESVDFTNITVRVFSTTGTAVTGAIFADWDASI